jgi:general secretion pathway protein F
LQDIAIMTRQFATLQAAHVPLDESLRALTAQVENPLLQNTLSSIKEGVQEGKSLAESMSAYPAVFDRLYVNMVRAGESSGTLNIVLTRLADFIEYQVKIRGQILSAITYPLLMMVASGGVIAYLFISVVPKLTKVFESLKVTMPWYTKLLINISAFLQVWWPAVIMGGILGYLWFNRWVGTTEGKKKFDTWSLKLPIFGSIVMRLNVSRFTRTLSTLLASGVPIIQALEITVNVISNSLIAEVVDKAKISVQEGELLGTVIERSGRFPPLVVHMIMTGERTGQLEEMLGHVAVAYDAEVERKVEAMISIIEPIMIIVMAGISATVIVGMLMPMLSVMSQIR